MVNMLKRPSRCLGRWLVAQRRVNTLSGVVADEWSYSGPRRGVQLFADRQCMITR